MRVFSGYYPLKPTRTSHVLNEFSILGLGSALAYTPSVVCVGTYFDKRRALANGISLSGAAVGSMTG